MPDVLDNTTTTDNLRDTTMGGGSLFARGALLIGNNPVKILVTTAFETGQERDTLYPFISPTVFPLTSGDPSSYTQGKRERIVGVQVASAKVGFPAQVSGWLLEPGLAGPDIGAIFTSQISPSGIITPPIIVSVLDTARVSMNAPPLVLGSGTNPPVALKGSYDFNTNGGIFGTRGITTGFFVQESGIFECTAYAVFQFNAAGDRYVSVRKNGSGIDEFADVRGAAPGLVTEIIISDEIQLNAGEYVELYVYQASGGNLNLTLGRLTLIKVQ